MFHVQSSIELPYAINQFSLLNLFSLGVTAELYERI